MNIGFIQIVAVFVVTFIAAIDQFNLLESLYQPIVTGPVIGAILGDVQMGLVVGGTYQLMTIGNMPVGGAQPPNAVIGGIMATVLAISLNLPKEEAATAVGLAVPFALLGQYGVTSLFAVLDYSTESAENPDFSPSPADIEAWEEKHGRIPEGAFVAFRFYWSKKWPDAEAMANHDAEGVAHYPGWNPEVVAWLIDERDITAIGHETTDTDQGIVVSGGALPAELLLLQRDKWQIELLANLRQVPATGALIVATWPKPQAGNGFPARAFAILPAS